MSRKRQSAKAAEDGFFPVRMSEVRPQGGAPALFVNDRPHTGLTYFFGRVTDSAPDIRKFAEAGIHAFSGCFGLADTSTESGRRTVRERFDYAIAAHPRVLILPRVGLSWIGNDGPRFEKYRDERQVNVDPVTGVRETTGSFSFSSERWRTDYSRQLCDFVRFCEQEYGDHILGYHLAAGRRRFGLQRRRTGDTDERQGADRDHRGGADRDVAHGAIREDARGGDRGRL